MSATKRITGIISSNDLASTPSLRMFSTTKTIRYRMYIMTATAPVSIMKNTAGFLPLSVTLVMTASFDPL